MPTVNSLFSHQVSVIMGDFLYSRAVVELVRAGDLEVLRVLSDATNAMTVGEMRQLTALDALGFTEDDYEALIRSKTASLLSAACEIGALAGARARRAALARYGERLGMAFQVADDLLDYTRDERVTGKPGGLDLREHKVTLPLIAALRTMSAAERRDVERCSTRPSRTTSRSRAWSRSSPSAAGSTTRAAAATSTRARPSWRWTDFPTRPARGALHDAIAYALDRSQ